MSEIVIIAGTCGPGTGAYETGLLRLPDGTLRGVEDLDTLVLTPPETPPPRRSGIARGLRDALAATGPLPNPFRLAASVAGVGLDVLEGGGRAGTTVDLWFRDGATARIQTDADTAARIERDRAVVLGAVLRLSGSVTAGSDLMAGPVPVAPEDGAMEAGPAPAESAPPDGQSLASLFAYEKRGGRVRRLSKALDEG